MCSRSVENELTIFHQQEPPCHLFPFGFRDTPAQAQSCWGLSTLSQAIPVFVNNASFEADAISDGGFLLTIPNWVIDPSIAIPGGNPVGVGNPSAAQYPGGATPDGQNAAFSKDGTISQVLAATLAANTTYTLRIDVGHRLDNPPFLGYSVQLLAGGAILSISTM